MGDSSFASINGVLYPSPESSLLEAIDVGFRGMSGAIAVNQGTQELVGMFVGRGAALGLKEGAELPEIIHYLSKKEEGREVSDTKLTEPTIIPSLPSELKILCKYLGEKFDKLEKKVEIVDKKVDYLLQNTLLKHDINQVLTIVAQRRGLIVPGHIIAKHIETGSAVEIRSFAKLQED